MYTPILDNLIRQLGCEEIMVRNAKISTAILLPLVFAVSIIGWSLVYVAFC